MIEEFEVININKNDLWTYYLYKFKLNSTFYYSDYHVACERSRIIFGTRYHRLEGKSVTIRFSKELMDEIKTIVLKKPEIRLRHLVNPYKIW